MAPRICHVCGHANPPDARYCNQCGAFLDLALAPEQATTEERRWVTVLFADLVNSTALVEHMDPEDARELISSCFDGLAREIVAAGGMVDKFMGDAVMAIFGAPVAHEDDSARALRAALRMHAFLISFNAEQHLRLDLRIGVNTGEVVVGARSVGGLIEYTATGDVVNVAARLQQTAQPGQIVAGAETVRHAGAGFRTRARTAAAIRGKQEPVASYLLEGLADGGGSAAIEVRLVNRRVELARLSRYLQQLARGRGRLVFLSGEPGIGKSRLIAEVRRLLPADVRWTEGRARSDGATLNYHVFRSVTEQLFGLTGMTDAESGADHLRRMLAGIGTPEAFPYLAKVTDLPTRPLDYEQLEHLQPAQVEQRAIRDLSTLVEAVARRHPGVLALDDLHWADPASLALIGGFLPLVARVPLLLLLSFRDEPGIGIETIRARARTELPRWTTELSLRPLTPRQTGQLVDQLLGDAPASAGLRDVVRDRSDGNPLFVEEIVRSVLDHASAEVHGDGLDRLPVNIQGIILARVDRLPEATRQALLVASVVGREFDVALLRQVEPRIDVAALRPAVVADVLDALDASGEERFTFRHALTREAIYQTLLMRRRRELHGRVAQAIVARLRHPSDDPALLAYHFGQAQRWSDVVTYASLAGEEASRAFASRDAVSHFTQALGALDHLGSRAVIARRAGLLRDRARAYERTGDWQRALGDYEAAVPLAGDDALRESILLSLARLLTDHDDYPGALRWTEQALQLGRVSGDRGSYARALSMEARVLVRQSRAQEAVERLNEALAVHRELGDRRGEAVALDNLAAPLSLLGDVEGAHDRQLAALSIYMELGDREREADVRSVLAEWLWFRGDFLGGLTMARLARSIHEELGVQRYQAHDLLVEGMALSTLGRFREALDVLGEAVKQAERLEHPEWVAHALVPMGVAYRALRRYRRARQAFTRAMELGEQIGARLWAQLGCIGLGFTHRLEGNAASAEACFRAALAAPEGLQYARARAMTGLALLELDRGNPQLADDWTRWSIAISQAAPYIEALLEAQIIRGQTLVALGARTEGLALLEDTHERARSLSARPLQAQSRMALASASEASRVRS